MSPQSAIQELLAAAIRAAGEVAQTRVGRGVQVTPGDPAAATALLRFDLQFDNEARLTWYVSNEDATGFSDLLIGGTGDRGAVLTEMHLDALSGVFSDMLDRAVEGLNAGLRQPIAAGGVDMGMEGALPGAMAGELQVAFALNVDGFGQLTIIEHANEAMVATLEGLMDPAQVAAASTAQPAAVPQAPVAGVPGHDPAAAVHAPAVPGAMPPGAAAPGAVPGGAPMPGGMPAQGPGHAQVHMAGQHDGIDNVVQLPNLGAHTAAHVRRDLSMLLNVPLRVTVELGRAERTIRELLELNVGSILELSKLAGDPMDIMVNGRVLARGEVVVIDEEFGIRVTEICSPEQRLQTGLG